MKELEKAKKITRDNEKIARDLYRLEG